MAEDGRETILTSHLLNPASNIYIMQRRTGGGTCFYRRGRPPGARSIERHFRVDRSRIHGLGVFTMAGLGGRQAALCSTSNKSVCIALL